MVNKARGEVEVSVGGLNLILCAEMARLAAISGELGTVSMMEIAQRVSDREPQALLACLKYLDISDNDEAINKLQIFDVMQIIDNILVAFAGGEEILESREKKQKAATKKK